MILRLLSALMIALALASAGHAAAVKQKVYFAFNTAKMSDAALELMPMIAKAIKDSGTTNVVLTGYCDTAEQAPTLLSRYRAKAVADQLREHGIPDSVSIEWSGKGTSDLDAPTGPGVREPMNRRVTIAY